MSTELINAVIKGNIEKVVEIISRPETNINALGNFFYKEKEYAPARSFKGTALVVAFLFGRADIARVLLNNGAKPVLPHYEKDCPYDALEANAFAACFALPSFRCNNELFKLMLAKVPYINLRIETGRGFSGKLQDFFLNDNQYVDNQEDRVRFCVYEAFFRKETTSFVIPLIKKFNIEISCALLQKYLGDRKLTNQEIECANQLIQELARFSQISQEQAKDLQEFLYGKINAALEVSFFPLSLQKHLKDKPAVTFIQLFRELQHQLYDIPVVDMASPQNFYKEKYNEVERKEIIKYQNPQHLTSFLETPQIEIFALLCKSYTYERQESEAAILLAQLIYFYPKDLDTEMKNKIFKLLGIWSKYSQEMKIIWAEKNALEKELDESKERISKLEETVRQLETKKAEDLTNFEVKLQALESQTQLRILKLEEDFRQREKKEDLKNFEGSQALQGQNKRSFDLSSNSNSNTNPSYSILSYFKKPQSNSDEQGGHVDKKPKLK